MRSTKKVGRKRKRKRDESKKDEAASYTFSSSASSSCDSPNSSCSESSSFIRCRKESLTLEHSIANSDSDLEICHSPNADSKSKACLSESASNSTKQSASSGKPVQKRRRTLQLKKKWPKTSIETEDENEAKALEKCSTTEALIPPESDAEIEEPNAFSEEYMSQLSLNPGTFKKILECVQNGALLDGENNPSVSRSSATPRSTCRVKEVVLKVCCEYLRLLAVEMLDRSVETALAEESLTLDESHLSKIVVSLLLDT